MTDISKRVAQMLKCVVIFAYIVIVPVRFEGYRCDIIECFKGGGRKGDKGTKGINELKKMKEYTRELIIC